MTRTTRSRTWQGALAGVAAASVLAASVAYPASAFAQRRDPGDRGGGGSPAPRRENPPTRREDPAPRRESPAPPIQRETSPTPRREEYRPAPSREEYRPAPRREETRPEPRREDPTPRREETRPEPRRIDPAPSRDNPIIRQERRPAEPGDRTGPRRDPGDREVRRDETRPPSNNDSRSEPGLRSGPPDRRNPGDVSDRTRPRGGTGTAPSRDNTYTPGDRSRPGTVVRPSQRSSGDPAPRVNRAHDLFTRTSEGRRYRNGIVLRQGTYIRDRWLHGYFPSDYSSYPYYYPSSGFNLGVTYCSPYSDYYGVLPPYIYQRNVYYRRPSVVYIDPPVYVDDVYRGYDDSGDYYLNRDDYYDSAGPRSGGLDRALSDLRDAFRYSDIGLLADLTDPGVRIAVFRRGQYEYSLEPNDYLDMTRDAMRNMDTVEFTLNRVRRRSDDAYAASGKHVYRDRDGRTRTVYVSYVLESVRGRWTITQVGTAPERIND